MERQYLLVPLCNLQVLLMEIGQAHLQLLIAVQEKLLLHIKILLIQKVDLLPLPFQEHL